MKNVKKKQKIIVALSGGVDSSVAAYLLQKQGYAVKGVYLQVWSKDDYLSNCPWEEEIQSAAAAAGHLDIPFRSIHVEEQYKKKVVEYMVEGYRRGITPNPDIMCNRKIKFGVFFDWAVSAGADFIATGHYVKKSTTTNKIQLLKGIDQNKDQSYFLYTLNQKKLAKILFPIGDYTKPSIRKMAKKISLPNWNRKDSQGICFIGKVELPRFLQEYIKPKKGKVITTDGETIGDHNGVYYYTIGQRHGLDLGSHTGSDAYYIVEKRLKDNVIVIAKGKKNPALYKSVLSCTHMNWIAGNEPSLPLNCSAKIRYRQKDQECMVKPSPSPESERESTRQSAKTYHVTFTKPQWAVAPGQSIVFYHGDECLGGGIITVI